MILIHSVTLVWGVSGTNQIVLKYVMAGREKNSNHKHLLAGHSLIKKKRKKYPTHTTNEADFRGKKVYLQAPKFGNLPLQDY